MFRFIESLLLSFTNQLFPAICLGCHKLAETQNSILCISCRVNLPETGQHLEPYDLSLLNKFAGKVPVKFLASYMYFNKGGVVQRLIHSFKYRGQKEAIRELAGWYGYQLKSQCTQLHEIDLVIGVPLHKDRLRQRGYNQADYIALGIAEALDIPAQNDVLVRTHFRESQTHKSRLERWDNVKSVFSVVHPEAIRGKNVLLVDDVLTTGATLESCTVELVKSDCKSVSIITLAVAGK